jgi:hypothetical protein
MANQMVALQARAPQSAGLGPAIAQGAQMINMMAQQRAAERQAAQAQQAMDINAAQEARAAAKAVPEMKEAEAKAGAAQVKYVMDFMDASELAIANVRDPQQARAVGNRLKQMFPEPEFQQSIDETLGSLPQDPAQFEAWREQALFLTPRISWRANFSVRRLAAKSALSPCRNTAKAVLLKCRGRASKRLTTCSILRMTAAIFSLYRRRSRVLAALAAAIRLAA